MRAALRLLALVGSVLFAAVAAAAPCRDNGVQVDVIQRGDVIELRARSERVSYYTLTLTFSAQNMSATSRSPVTVESRGRRQLSVVTLRGRDGGKAWTYDYVFSWRPGARFGQHDAGYRYALPFDAGRRFTVSQGPLGAFSHGKGSFDEQAYDWLMPTGTAVHAARDGEVVATRADSSRGGASIHFKHCENYVIIRHRDGSFAEYSHLRSGGVRVRLGQRVRAGEVLGFSGNTGRSSEPHLHFAVFKTIDGGSRETFPIVFAN